MTTPTEHGDSHGTPSRGRAMRCFAFVLAFAAGLLAARAGQAQMVPFAFWSRAAPASLSLVQSPNARTFTVSWSAGSGNGGAGGCRLQYQRQSDGAWLTVASPATVNCDAPGSAAGTVSLPGDGWNGTSWSTVRSVRLQRVSDGAALGTLGSLTCSVRGGSSSPTPNLDENCNGAWDDVVLSGANYGNSFWDARWVQCCTCTYGGYNNCAAGWSGPVQGCSGWFVDDNPYPPSSYRDGVVCPTPTYN